MIDFFKTENELRYVIRDYLNETYKKEEILNKFDLKQCIQCENIELEEDMFDTEGIVNGGIGYICESCKEDL